MSENALTKYQEQESAVVSMTAFENLGNIAKRISAAVLNVGTVKKSGRNQHYNYDYATAEDVKAGARRALAEAGISILPLMRKVEQRQSGKMTITRAHFDFVVACEEGHIIVPWVADSQDAGDKGINKCATIATKYFLINLLQIPTGVEEDPDGEAPKKAPPRHRPRKQSQPSKKQAAERPRQVSTSDNGKGYSWPAQTVTSIVNSKLAEHARQAVGMLNKSEKLTPEMGTDTALAWATAYRQARDAGSDSSQAAKAGDASLE